MWTLDSLHTVPRFSVLHNILNLHRISQLTFADSTRGILRFFLVSDIPRTNPPPSLFPLVNGEEVTAERNRFPKLMNMSSCNVEHEAIFVCSNCHWTSWLWAVVVGRRPLRRAHDVIYIYIYIYIHTYKCETIISWDNTMVSIGPITQQQRWTMCVHTKCWWNWMIDQSILWWFQSGGALVKLWLHVSPGQW